MSNSEVTIYLVDDEPDVTSALTWLLESIKLKTKSFSSAREFLAEIAHERGPMCSVLDLRMPEISGLELLKEMRGLGIKYPVIFLTAHGDIPAAVAAMRLGAIDFLQKPFNAQTFLDTLNIAIRKCKEEFYEDQKNSSETESLRKLSDREKEILALLIKGKTSKEIARQLSISPKTVDVHRASIMRKTESDKLSDLIDKFG